MPDPRSDLQRLGQEFDADVVEAVAETLALHALPDRYSWAGLHESARELWREDARAAIAAARPMIEKEAWQPIETAPRDGTRIDVWVDGEFPGRRTDVSWREPTDGEWWVHGGDTIETPDATWHDPFGPLGSFEPPTHWRPLPAPPSIEPQS